MAMQRSRGLVRMGSRNLRKHLLESGRAVLGMDVGGYRVGFAFAQNVESFAMPLKVIKRHRGSNEMVAQYLNTIARSLNIGGLVVGYPLDTHGREGVMCAKVSRFVRQLSRDVKFELPYTFQDESMSTLEAYEGLKGDLGEE